MDDSHLKFLKALESALSSSDCAWLEVWDLYVNHPCPKEVLFRQLQRVRFRYRLTSVQLHDVEQEFWLLLGERLRNRPDLGLDFKRATKTFPGWLSTVIRRLVQLAISRQTRVKAQYQLFTEPTARRDELPHFVLAELLDKLSTEQRDCVLLFLDGYTLRQTAKHLGIPLSRARRQLKRAFGLLQSNFEPI